MRRMALTAIGADRPGIVAGVCRVVFEAGGNLRDTSMTILSGEFAMILIVTIPATLDLAAFDRKLDPVRRDLAIEIVFRELPSATTGTGASPSLPGATAPEGEDAYLVKVMGADRPGIVLGVAEAMARHRINITDLHTRMLSEDQRPVYMMMMEVVAPAGVDMDAVSQELAELGRRLSVEISTRRLDVAAL